MNIRRLKDNEDEIHETHSRICYTIEKMKIIQRNLGETSPNKSAQYKQKLLNQFNRLEDILTTDLSEEQDLDDR
jgi:hypothetical protein